MLNLKNIFRPPEAKTSRTAKVLAFESGGRARWTPRDYAALAREGYLTNAIVHRAVRLIAENAASCGFLLYEGAQERDAHPLSQLLTRPNARQDGASFFEALYAHMLLAGNAYVEAVALGDQVRELHTLRPDRMKVVPGHDGWPEAYEYSVAKRSVRFDQLASSVPPILHLTFFHPLDDHYGLAPIEAAAVAVDAAVQIGVLSITLTAPPMSPPEGARYVVAAGATGAWVGHAKAITTWEDGAWRFVTPKAGWFLWSAGDDGLFVYDGTAWRNLHDLTTALDNAAHIGINTTATSPNLLTVRSNAALFNAIAVANGGTGDARVQISKESSAKTASVVFSDAFSGRAEFGLLGSNAFKLKVSNDGSTFVEALNIDQSSGNVTLPRGLSLTGVISPAQITANQNDYNPAGIAAASVLNLSSDASRNVSGLAGGAEGRVLGLFNIGSQPLVLLDENASSTAANRFTLGGDLIVSAKQAVVLRYDGTSSRWLAIARPVLTIMNANTLKGNNTGAAANGADLTVAQVQTMLGLPAVLVKVSNVNLNAVADTAFSFALPSARYKLQNIFVENIGTTASITTAQFGVFSAASGGGTAMVASGTSLSGLTSNAANTAGTVAVVAGITTASWTYTTLYLRVTQAQGASAAANFTFWFVSL